MEILIVIDAQNDFITGKLAVPGAEEACENIHRELLHTSAAVLFTRDIHDPDTYALSIEGKRIPEHCTTQTSGSEIPRTLLSVFGHLGGYFPPVVEKHTFAYMDWRTILQFFAHPESVDGIIIMGFCTDICVLSNAIVLRSLFPNVPIRVKADCCAGSTPELHEAALKVMAANLIEII